MKRKLVITEYKGKVLSALFENSKVVELRVDEERQDYGLGNIYIGKVKDVVSSIDGAFVEIAPGVACYYPLAELPTAIFTRKQGKKPIVPGDEILVQVSREALKTKAPSVTTNLNFPGKYLVLTSGKNQIGISGKIKEPDRSRLKALFPQEEYADYGLIIRTNAAAASGEAVLQEAERLAAEYSEIKSRAMTRTCFSKISDSPREYLRFISDVNQEGMDEIVTDRDGIYEEIKEYLSRNMPDYLCKLDFYEDPFQNLLKKYALDDVITRCFHERVWLPSGAYLVIQCTEALVVVDVNTGKVENKKRSEDVFRKVNREAAEEIARQIRLRNLSGIIVVDFINMSDEDEMELREYLNGFIRLDPIQTTLVDVTKLQLFELTRKKIRKPVTAYFS